MSVAERTPFRHLVKDLIKDDTMGIRMFSDSNIPDVAEDYWGMDLKMPRWIGEAHNRLAGQRIFIFGTGPSLVEQLPLLIHMKEEYTITCNRVKRWEELPFVPWTHCVTEPGPLVAWGAGVGYNYDFPEATNKVACCWTRVTAKGWNWLPKAPDDLQMRWQGCFGMGGFLPPIPTAWASPLTITQLALWMGFTKIYILGTELTQVGQAWDKEQGTTKYPRNIRSIMECADRLTRDIYRNGREIWDCTPDGRMNREGVMPYRELSEVLSE